MSKTVFLVYDYYNSNLYDHADYIGTITAHGSGCKALRNGIKIIEVKIDSKDIGDAGGRMMKLTITFKDEFEKHMKRQFGSFTNPQVYNVKSMRIEGRYLYSTISSTMRWIMDDIAQVYCE